MDISRNIMIKIEAKLIKPIEGWYDWFFWASFKSIEEADEALDNLNKSKIFSFRKQIL